MSPPPHWLGRNMVSHMVYGYMDQSMDRLQVVHSLPTQYVRGAEPYLTVLYPRSIYVHVNTERSCDVVGLHAKRTA